MQMQSIAPQKRMRVGVYGVAMNAGKILLIKQTQGPHAGKLDFPGGGIEFGESAEQALRREFSEEIALSFDSLSLLHNLTATIEVPRSLENDPYSFFQIGMIYEVKGLHAINGEGEFTPVWVDPTSLVETQCTPLLWKYLRTHRAS